MRITDNDTDRGPAPSSPFRWRSPLAAASQYRPVSVLDDTFAEHPTEHMATHNQRRARKKQGLANWRLIRY
jgi:hypothetical protein